MNNSYDARDYDSSFSNGLWQGVKASIILSLCIGVFSALAANQSTLMSFITHLLGLFSYVLVLITVVTFVVLLIIAYPAVLLLKYFNMDSEISAALLGASIVFAFLRWVSSGNMSPTYYFIVLYGLVCGYAFMRGYKKGVTK